MMSEENLKESFSETRSERSSEIGEDNSASKTENVGVESSDSLRNATQTCGLLRMLVERKCYADYVTMNALTLEQQVT